MTATAYSNELLVRDQSVTSIYINNQSESDFFFSQPSIFYDGERIKLNFRLKAFATPDFALLRGLIEFSRSKDFRFAYHTEEKTFETDIKSDQLSTLNKFLGYVNDTFIREKKFRAALKEAIRFEESYRVACASVYQH